MSLQIEKNEGYLNIWFHFFYLFTDSPKTKFFSVAELDCKGLIPVVVLSLSLWNQKVLQRYKHVLTE